MNQILFIYFLACIICITLASTSFPIQLSITQEKRFLPYEISTYTQHVNIRIETGSHVDIQTNLPNELFIVLDSSGSMAGANKWINAISSIKHIIQNMNTNDKLHLVRYSSDSSIVFENAHDQQAMINMLSTLYASGGTNLMAGLNQVTHLLKKYSDRLTVKRAFILSDGQINEGITDHNLLLKEIATIKKTFDITICSFGIGYDFDEKLMTNIADYGSGDYFFIKGAESMEKVIGIAYKGFQNLMGIDAYLKVINKYDARIIDIYGYEMKEDSEEQIIPIGNLRYNDMMNILLEMEVKITKELLQKSEIDYMIVELWMTDVIDRLPKLITTSTLLLSLSRDDKALNELNEIIKHLVELEKIQRREREVTKLLQEQNVKEAFLYSQSLSDQISASQAKLSSMTVSEDEKATLQFTQRKVNTMARRAAAMTSSFQSGSEDSNNLAMQQAYYEKLNSRYSSAHDDL